MKVNAAMMFDQDDRGFTLRWTDTGNEAQRFLQMGGGLALFGVFALVVGPYRIGPAGLYVGAGLLLFGGVFVAVGLFSNPVISTMSRFDLASRVVTVDRRRKNGGAEKREIAFGDIESLYCLTIRSKGSQTNTACIRLRSGEQLPIGRSSDREVAMERDLATIRSKAGFGRPEQSTAAKLVTGFFGVSKR